MPQLNVLGAVVEAYDIRPAAREQIISVGAKPVELDIEAENTETKGGYATEQSDDFLKRQQQAMANVLSPARYCDYHCCDSWP